MPLPYNYDEEAAPGGGTATDMAGYDPTGTNNMPPGAVVDPVTGQVIDPVTGLPVGPGGSGSFNSSDALAYATRDNAPVGYCARGVANITERQGLGNFRGLDAHDFSGRMASQGWRLDTRYNQYNAPEGSMLLYNSDARLGQPLTTGRSGRPTGGSRFGHVEMVTYNSSGNRGYTSSHTSSRPGGTVNHNFMGVWVRN